MRRAGYAAVSAAAILWAIGGAYASRLIDQGASFVELTEARAWITAAALGAAALVRSSPEPAGTPARPRWWLIIVFGLSIAGANFTYYAALSRLPVAIAITVQYTAAGLVVLWFALAEHQPVSRRVVGALAAALFGVALLAEVPALVSGGGLRLDMVGFGLAGLSAVAYATYMITGEHMGRVLNARQSVLRGFVVASVLWAVVQLVRGRPDTLLEPRFAFGVVFLAVATTIAPFLLFVWGLRRVRASEAGIVSTLEPLAAAVIAFLWLGQVLSPWQLVGGALVIVGIGLVQAERPLSEQVLAERAAVE